VNAVGNLSLVGGKSIGRFGLTGYWLHVDMRVHVNILTTAVRGWLVGEIRASCSNCYLNGNTIRVEGQHCLPLWDAVLMS
jgi:hypothetical protein